MNPSILSDAVTVAQLAEFDEFIDVRSPSEFREDHIPGAVNCPVLDDEERARVGTLYKQVSPFQARKTGAALIARNIANHLDHFSDKPRSWRPLIYCWRGGNRSGAMAQVMKQIGWDAGRLQGGYRVYRRAVIESLASLPQMFDFRVVCGLTGSGKSRLLSALDKIDAQVLDLEQIAAHRGSVLGQIPDIAQPTQKMFESILWSRLKNLDPSKPVYVEAESRKIGRLQLPSELLDAMWRAACIRLEMETPLRVSLLKEDYLHFFGNPEEFCKKLEFLNTFYAKEQIARWQALARQGRADELVCELLEKHYDPGYSRSTFKHYSRYAEGWILRLSEPSVSAFAQLARLVLGENVE